MICVFVLTHCWFPPMYRYKYPHYYLLRIVLNTHRLTWLPSTNPEGLFVQRRNNAKLRKLQRTKLLSLWPLSTLECTTGSSPGLLTSTCRTMAVSMCRLRHKPPKELERFKLRSIGMLCRCCPTYSMISTMLFAIWLQGKEMSLSIPCDVRP